MTAHLSRRETHPRSTARTAAWRLRRLAVALTAATCGLLASAAVVPAAVAIVVSGSRGGTAQLTPALATTVRVVIAGGTAGRQITLIALGAAVLAAAVLLDGSWPPAGPPPPWTGNAFS